MLMTFFEWKQSARGALAPLGQTWATSVVAVQRFGARMAIFARARLFIPRLPPSYPGRPAHTRSAMALRFIITGVLAAIVLAVLIGFNYVVKPAFIKGIMSSQVPPPATVTSEPAKTEKWVEQLTSIGTLISSHGVDVASQVAGIVTEVYAERGSEVDQGTPLVQLDVAVEEAD